MKGALGKMCVHYYVFEEPDGRYSKGKCKLCGAETTGDNGFTALNPVMCAKIFRQRYFVDKKKLVNLKHYALGEDNPMWDDVVRTVERG